ncbi:MAG TPA: glycosyltransferase family A protein [Polyangiaceae bacterium]|jgi:glycosyltransferase involved in cell wall biosynthesis|nr:glycosyltransferase family A protein [Polyangiaceae bacterium]
MPSVSAVVPTRNRPQHAVPCARSILQNPDLLELFFVDQSDDRKTEEALATIDDPRLTYVRSELRGVTNGRNVGIERSKGDIIAYTDDDCRAAPNWIASTAKIFAEDPAVAVVCGRVHVPPEIESQGFACGFEPQQRDWQHQYPPTDRDWGITANMSVRRNMLGDIGVFDPFLGAGAPLRSGGEPDFLFRALKQGYKVVNAKEVLVEHLGVRAPGEETARLLKNYASGTGAAFFKYVRLGDLDGTGLYLKHLAGCAHLIFTNVVHLHRPLGIGYTVAFVSGSLASLGYRVDRDRRMYVRS